MCPELFRRSATNMVRSVVHVQRRVLPSAPSILTYALVMAGLSNLLLNVNDCCAGDSQGQDPAAAESLKLFHQTVRPLLERRCLSCHNATDHQGDFSLQTQQQLLDSGYVVPGDVDSSQLLIVLSAAEDGSAPAMPKDSDPLAADAVAAVRDWIRSGAHWPEQLELQPPVISDFDWWSLQPLQQSSVPDVAGFAEDWVRNPIDAFVAARHREVGLQHAAEADRRTLIRRVTYDLIGLPPTPEEVAAFVDDPRSDAYEQLVDRLLQSPHYGERWARHWLDVVKYADTCGYDKDKLRPNAWPYRDYVIRAFNEDRPYSKFVQEQIAGDVLFPGSPDGILGLGFIAAGPWDFIGHVEVPESKIDGMVARNLDRDDMVTNTLNTFCSVTIQCARCHHHKFDPFTMEQYYSLQSVFAAVDRAERPYDTSPEVEQKRQELTRRRIDLDAQLKNLSEEIRAEGGEELREVEQKIAELKPLVVPVDKRPEFGYHSQIVAAAETEKWVEVDLGRPVDVRQVVLHPCHDDYAGIGAGFGFPVRFRITADNAVDRGADDAERSVRVVADQTTADFPNPGLAAFAVEADLQQVRYLRLTATKLAERSQDYILALAEMEVIDSDGSNVALSAVVNSPDSIEAPIRWRRSNLTDGIHVTAKEPGRVHEYQHLQQQLAAITARVQTPERLERRAKLTDDREAVAKELEQLPAGQMVYAAATQFRIQGNFRPTEGKPRQVRVLHRGVETQPGDLVTPGTIPLRAEEDWHFQLAADASEGERRAALAQWLTARENPLTWRSIVNRVWHYHFGRGIVESPN
ncbi:MAG: DUF1549 domain-containing protein, partial [Planctomycetaceae bacterium]|nr:DUF1549 domain-containing protein [Planctomycetaceae bacterium]